MIASLLSIKIHVHVIDNSNNEIRGGGVKWDAGGDEKQLIKFACMALHPINSFIASLCKATHLLSKYPQFT